MNQKEKEKLQSLRDQIKLSCEVCGRTPAKFRRFSKVTGLLVFSTHSQTKPHAVCDAHKRNFASEALFHNLLFGWWAVHAFIWNIIALIQLASGGSDCTDELKDLMIVRSIENKEAIARQAHVN